MRICIDPGHSAGQNQSPVVKEYFEGTQMFRLAQLLKAELERYGVEVICTRQRPEDNPDLLKRGNMARDCDLLLSLHSDAADAQSVDRCTVFHPISGAGAELATQLSMVMAATMGVSQGFRVKTKINGPGTADYYGVIRFAVAAGSVGMILEHSFHTNKRSAEWLLDDNNLRRLAKEEAAAVAKYYDLEEIEMRYHTLADLKADKDFGGAYLPTVEKLMEMGVLRGKGGTGDETILDLGEDAVRLLVILDRAGLF